MLSQIELEYLQNPKGFDANYSKALRHRIRGKVQALQTELRLLERAGYLGVMDNCNPVTEYYNLNPKANQADFSKQLVLRPGFEPGSATREAAILDRTILPEHIFGFSVHTHFTCINLLSF